VRAASAPPADIIQQGREEASEYLQPTWVPGYDSTADTLKGVAVYPYLTIAPLGTWMEVLVRMKADKRIGQALTVREG